MTSQLIRSLHSIPSKALGGVVSIGNFDGVHLGHQLLIQKMIDEARIHDAPTLVLTFEPHPLEFFAHPKKVLPRLTNLREKLYFFSKLGVDYVLTLPFNQRLANLSASQFVKDILHDKLKVRRIITGDDFHFGSKRQGDVPFLRLEGKRFHFSVTTVDPIFIEQERVSSTRIRKALADADHSLAERLLGHPYIMMGRIKKGDQLGRKLNCPTANIHLHRRLTPLQGVYTVYMHGISDKPWQGVANVGTRPTIDGTRALLEVHLLDFEGDLYGREVQIQFCEKLREEKYYPNLALLKAQMANDLIQARDYFKKQGAI